MKRRDFLKTAALVPLMDWSPAVTPTHRPSELEKAIAADHWPLAKPGLGAEILRLSRQLGTKHHHSIDSLMVYRNDNKRFPNRFLIWINPGKTTKFYKLEEKGTLPRPEWKKWYEEELNKSGFSKTGLESDEICVSLTTMPNWVNSYCPILGYAATEWSYTKWCIGERLGNGPWNPSQYIHPTMCYYKHGFPDQRSV